MDSSHENDNEAACAVCRNCSNVGVKFRNGNSVECDLESNESKCRSWLERCTISSDGESVYSSETSGTTNSSISENTHEEGEDENDISENEDVEYDSKVICVAEKVNKKAVEQLINKSNQYGDVRMKQCRKVHLGNVTKIYGPVHVTQTMSMVNSQTVTNQIFLQGAAVPVSSGKLSIIDRRSWLAQPPLEDKQYLQAPAKFVIISHTATEDGFTQAENVYLVRLVQTFHIESRKWSDIGYNFLIGSDGNVYEGRGWGVVGAHTLGYNIIGMGISFVGCFMNKLPPQSALNQVKLLIKQGVEVGAIDKDYFLVGHCQCSPTESPGRRLYDEIQTWEHWNSLISQENPSS